MNHSTLTPIPEVKPCSEIESQMTAIWSSMDELQFTITKLNERLNTCLISVPEAPHTGDKVRDTSCGSPLGQELESVNNQLLSKIYAIRHITERVAL